MLMARMAYLLDNFKDFGSTGLGWVVTGWSQYAQQSHAQQTGFACKDVGRARQTWRRCGTWLNS